MLATLLPIDAGQAFVFGVAVAREPLTCLAPPRLDQADNERILNPGGDATMDTQLTFYDVLGVQSGASADDVQRSYDAKMAVLAPVMISGAPSKVIAAADRARAALELARRTLADPVLREQYDTEVGIRRPGSGLVRPFAPPSEGLWGWDPSWNNNSSADPESMVADVLGVVADWLAPRRSRRSHVVVPDARGLLVGPARRVMTLCGLRAELVQLTVKPMPVEGIVVDQSVRPGARVRRSSTVTVQVWHPSPQPGRGA